MNLKLALKIEHKQFTAFASEVIIGKPGLGPLQDADVSRTPSPQGQEPEKGKPERRLRGQGS